MLIYWLKRNSYINVQLQCLNFSSVTQLMSLRGGYYETRLRGSQEKIVSFSKDFEEEFRAVVLSHGIPEAKAEWYVKWAFLEAAVFVRLMAFLLLITYCKIRANLFKFFGANSFDFEQIIRISIWASSNNSCGKNRADPFDRLKFFFCGGI